MKVLNKLKIRSVRYDFEIEVLVRAVWANATLESVPISVHYDAKTRAGSHFDPWWDNVRISLAYTRLVLRNFVPWPHKKLVENPESPQKKLSLRQFRETIRRLIRERISPTEIASACATGIFFGTLPLIGFHSATVIFFATRLKLNRLIAFNTSHLCAPPVVPALAILAGFYLRNGRMMREFTVQTLGYEIHQRLIDYFLGAIVLAPVLAGLMWLLVFLAAIGTQKFIRRGSVVPHG